jgi:AcrR family transcriptional regulator
MRRAGYLHCGGVPVGSVQVREPAAGYALGRDLVSKEEGDTRERIQSVTLRLFRERGSEKTSLREIAENLDVSKAALYYHFRSKDELIASVAAPFVDGFGELLDAAERGRRDGDMARRLVEGYIDLLFDQRPVVAWLRDDLAVRAHPAIGPVLNRQGERLRTLLGGADMTFEEQVRVTAALGALSAGVAQFPDAGSAELRGPLLRATWAVLDK